MVITRIPLNYKNHIEEDIESNQGQKREATGDDAELFKNRKRNHVPRKVGSLQKGEYL